MASLPNAHHHAQAESLYRSHHQWLKNWLQQKIGCAEKASDCAHDAFYRVLSRPDSGEVKQPKAFLAKIATRLLIDSARRFRLEQAWREAYAEMEAEHSFAPSAEEVNEVLDILERVASLLEGLGEKPRRAFLRFRLDGASQAEIAEELGVSVSMVKKYVAQGLLHCHLALQENPM
ncbi:sigma-70 family RNA polymerase sigma factor [Halomonas sp. LC1]|uniref:sigma-70 family RNA polymerase sigma factor n=1 Tax=Halomonas sp. LC1 TaxID=3043733 RepID=UPI00255232F6|nr:sigma-70 family RNA polymerase sigma factor [Halomonas sp. LC1]MDK9687106.1 sigma-70 family RNA polymerase sigma factor [Halomonas sp. LC1]